MPSAREVVLGRRARGQVGKRFDPKTGQGRVEAVKGAYERAVGNGVDVQPLLY